MLILAVDSSLDRPGFAVLEVDDKRRIKLLTTTVVDNKKDKHKTTAQKLQEIARAFHYLCTMYKPEALVRERGFSRFPAATQKIFRVVGVLDFVAYDSFGLEFEEFTPKTVKVTIAGSGVADKEEVANILPRYVGEYHYMTDDESDATAVGITYAIEFGLITRQNPDPRKGPKIGRPRKRTSKASKKKVKNDSEQLNSNNADDK